MTKEIKTKPSEISRKRKSCEDDSEFPDTRPKRPRCDDEEFYKKWMLWIEESEKVGCAVFCVCTAVDPYYCKCASIVTE